MKDPFVAEVRKYRLEHTKNFNFDVHAICENFRKYQEELYEKSEIDENKKYIYKSHQRTANNHSKFE